MTLNSDFRRTRIVATLGPASSNPKAIGELIDAGVDVFRLNFSHGDHEAHREVVNIIRDSSAQSGVNTGILQDLCGPKLRVGHFTGDAVELEKGAEFTVCCREIAEGNARQVEMSYRHLCNDVRPGDELLLDDGKLKLEVKLIEGEDIRCIVVVGGMLSSNKGLNVPGRDLSIPALTEKDVEDLRFGAEIGVDWVAMSFVRNRDDIVLARHYLNRYGSNARLMAKIEKPSAVENFAEILASCNGIMVARGDLGVELPPERVPQIQKHLISTCRRAAKPVITATQMLESMINNPNPTRAEASDVANAIYDGTDAVMLSAETAVGNYAKEAVEIMARIAKTVESDNLFWQRARFKNGAGGAEIADGVAFSACKVAESLHAKVIVVFTQSGSTAKRIVSNRFEYPVLALTPDKRTCSALRLLWGALPVTGSQVSTSDDMVAEANKHILATGLAQPGELYIITAGVPFGIQGSTNMIRVEQVRAE